MTTLIQWLSLYRTEVAIVSAVSLVMLGLSLFATPWILARLPADYFCRQRVAPPRSIRSLLIGITRNVVGICFLLLGLILMVTPGPGLVCIALGLALCDLPGKAWLMAKLVNNPSVFTALNWARQKAHASPFERPDIH